MPGILLLAALAFAGLSDFFGPFWTTKLDHKKLSIWASGIRTQDQRIVPR
jgi:hypothetical protein